MNGETPLEFWTKERDNASHLLESASTPRERQAYQDSLNHANKQIEAIANGSYQAPSVSITVLKKIST
jgi:type IV secretory pathway component VirB8